MRSPSTQFTQGQNRLGGSWATIIKLTDGVNTWYFGDREITFSDGTHVHNLLISHSGIAESVDIFTRSWSVSNVSVTLSNMKYAKGDGSDTWIDLAEQLEDIRFNDATIYLLAGENVTELSQCLERYVGVVTVPPEYSESEIVIQLTDKAPYYDKSVPQNLVHTIYPDTASITPGSSGRYIPLVYGDFAFEGGDTETFTREGTGLALAEYYSSRHVVVSDHPLNAFTELWSEEPQLSDPVLHLSPPSLNTDDSGYGTGRCQWPGWVRGFIHAAHKETVESGSPASSSYRPGRYWWDEDSENALDRSDSTYCTLIDYIDTGSLMTSESIWIVDEEGIIGEKNSNKIMTDIDIQARLDRHGNVLASSDWLLWYGYDEYESQTGPAAPSGTWSTVTGYSYPATDKTEKFAIGLDFTIAGGSDGTRDNYDMAHLYGVRLRITYAPDYQAHKMYAECKGREYGSWITGRSSNYADGDLIEDPAGIIESLLRDELGFTDSDINMPSFINAENTSVTARMNLHTDNRMSAYRAIQQLSEQSTFACFWSGTGKFTLIPLNDASPSTDKTIPWSHIKANTLKVSKTKTLANYLDVSARWQAEYGVYGDITSQNDYTSQSATGQTLVKTVKWPNVAGSAANHLMDFLVHANTGLLSNPHIIIQMETVGFTNADLEIGDWIELDDTSVDPHIKAPGGTSWSGKQMLVTALRQNQFSTYIEAIEI